MAKERSGKVGNCVFHGPIPSAEKLLTTLITLFAEQEGVRIDYTIKDNPNKKPKEDENERVEGF